MSLHIVGQRSLLPVEISAKQKKPLLTSGGESVNVSPACWLLARVLTESASVGGLCPALDCRYALASAEEVTSKDNIEHNTSAHLQVRQLNLSNTSSIR